MTRARDDQKGAGSSQRPNAAEIAKLVAANEAVPAHTPPAVDVPDDAMAIYGLPGVPGREARSTNHPVTKPPRS